MRGGSKFPTLFVDGAKTTLFEVADGAKATFSEVAESMSRRASIVRDPLSANSAARESPSDAFGRLRPKEEEEEESRLLTAKRIAAVTATVASTTGLLKINANMGSPFATRPEHDVKPPDRSQVTAESENFSKPYVAPVDQMVSSNKILPRPKPPPTPIVAKKKVEPPPPLPAAENKKLPEKKKTLPPAPVPPPPPPQVVKVTPVAPKTFVVEPVAATERERYGALFNVAETLSLATSPGGRVVVKEASILFAALALVQYARRPNLLLLAAILVVSRTSPLFDIWRQLAAPGNDGAFKTAWRVFAKPLQVIAVARLHSGRMNIASRVAYCTQIALCDTWKSQGALDNAKLAYAYAGTLALSALLFASTELGSGLCLVPSVACALAAASQSAELQAAYEEEEIEAKVQPRGLLASLFS